MSTAIDQARWHHAQEHEAGYWGDCLGWVTWIEFCKQEMYGRELGLFADFGDGMQGEFDMQGKSVLDVGGGPLSMTLRCTRAGRLTVVDPCRWPPSAMRRYRNYGIEFIQAAGEEIDQVLSPVVHYDEVWIYNVLQHVRDPEAILQAVRPFGDLLRIFEWVWIPADDCHPHVLTPEGLKKWLAWADPVITREQRLQEFGANATAFCGIFKMQTKNLP